MRRPAFGLLAGCLGNDLAPDNLDVLASRLSAQDWAEVPDLAAHHHISLLAGSLLSAVAAVPSGVQHRFATEAAARRSWQVRCLADLTQLAPMLEGHPWALLKGAVLADHVWSRRGVREYSDLDVLVRPASVRPLLEALLASGATLTTRNWKYVHDGGRAEMSLSLWRGSCIDLHWNVLGYPRGLPDVAFDTEQVLARRRMVEVGGGSTRLAVPAPDPVDMLLHVAVHALLEGVSALKHVGDIDQLLRHESLDGDELVARAAGQSSGLMLAVALQRSSGLRAPSPLDVLVPQLAGPAAWLRLMALNDRVNPLSRSDLRLSLRSLAGSTRGSTSASFSAFARFAGQEARNRARRWNSDERPLWSYPVDDGYRARVLSSLD